VGRTYIDWFPEPKKKKEPKRKEIKRGNKNVETLVKSEKQEFGNVVRGDGVERKRPERKKKKLGETQEVSTPLGGRLKYQAASRQDSRKCHQNGEKMREGHNLKKPTRAGGGQTDRSKCQFKRPLKKVRLVHRCPGGNPGTAGRGRGQKKKKPKKTTKNKAAEEVRRKRDSKKQQWRT